MKTLFDLDHHNYITNGTVGYRTSVRGLIFRDGKIALVHSGAWNYYVTPGGGQQEGEDDLATLIREVEEETGLVVIPETAAAYGLVTERGKGKQDDLFITENRYYICDVEEDIVAQKLEGYEAREKFTLKWVTPEEAISANEAFLASSEKTLFFRNFVEHQNKILARFVSESHR